MFMDLMQDVYHTFSERFMKAQLVINEPEPLQQMDMSAFMPSQPHGSAPQNGAAAAPTKRYNAVGILEDVPQDEPMAPKRTPEAKPRDRKDKKRR